MNTSLLRLFQRVSQDIQPPSPALGIVFEIVSTDYVSIASSYITESPNVNKDQLEKALVRMVTWPLTPNTSKWIEGILRGLIAAKKFSVLSLVTTTGIVSIARQMFIPQLRDGAFSVFEFLQLGFQHSPEAFHKTLPILTRIFRKLSLPQSDPVELKPYEIVRLLAGNDDVLENVGSAGSETVGIFLGKLADLIYTLMFQHTGFPELYSDMLTLLQVENRNRPSDQAMKEAILQGAWTSERLSDLSDNLKSRSSLGKAGLGNLGNTCYMNSFLQALFMTDPFREKLLEVPWKEEISSISQLEKTFAFMLKTQRQAYAPKGMLKVLPTWYSVGTQQDSSEYGRFLMEQLDIEYKQKVKGEKKEPFVEEFFGGKLENIIQCHKCQNVSKRQEDFIELPLAFPDVPTDPKVQVEISDLIQHYLSPEELKDANQYFCDTCQSYQDANKSMRVVKSPDHLVITLKRFAFDAVKKSRVKICQDVKYGTTLNLPTQEIQSGVQLENQHEHQVENQVESGRSYVLYAVIIHSGPSAEHGHYYTYARHSNLASHDDSWLQLNDSNVTLSKFESFASLSKHFGSDVPYILFYRAQDILPQISTSLEIPESLTKEVVQDNTNFLQEQENHFKNRAEKRKSYFYSGSRNNGRNDRDDHPPPPSFQGPGWIC
eukprot:TRINITY_DN2869_c0_g1_i3.p1 TRINITY_DN2869_c0_g1~~TRINITY_DN2869_c0_g1_i3.p1  ORF type:complete len:659 (-),score=190.40 TRINITY_DN2869_c0_g1_i3:54-2030(-)